MTYRHRAAATALLLLTAAGAPAQTPPPADAPPAPASPPAWSAGPIDFSGLIDGYYSLNLNHPSTQLNKIRNFDVKANQFSLNMAKIVMEHTADPVGFRVDLGFGRAFDIFHAAEPKDAPAIMRNLMQAYVSVKHPSMKGLQFDFGKFVTSAGAELTETHLNWNYSRALLYANGPYYHFGMRASMPMGKYFTGGFQVINGWNNVEDNNSGKTVGLTGAFTAGKFSWYNTYYTGPEKTATNQGYRHFYDTVMAYNPSDKVNFLGNFDYGVDKGANGDPNNEFYGVSGAMRVIPNSWFAMSPRLEWYNDKRGFITGTAQKLKEFTLTADFKMKEGFLTRLEYRRDWSSEPFFDRGNEPGSYKNQNTFLIGFVAYFGPK